MKNFSNKNYWKTQISHAILYQSFKVNFLVIVERFIRKSILNCQTTLHLNLKAAEENLNNKVQASKFENSFVRLINPD